MSKGIQGFRKGALCVFVCHLNSVPSEWPKDSQRCPLPHPFFLGLFCGFLLWLGQYISSRWPIVHQPWTGFQQANSPLLDVHILIFPATSKHVPFHSMIKIRIKVKILRWRDDPRLFEWVQYYHKSLYKMQEGHSQREDVGTKAEVREEKLCYVVDFRRQRKGSIATDKGGP